MNLPPISNSPGYVSQVGGPNQRIYFNNMGDLVISLEVGFGMGLTHIRELCISTVINLEILIMKSDAIMLIHTQNFLYIAWKLGYINR